MEVLGHLASLLVVKALIQTEGIVVPNQIKLSGVIDNEAVLYQIQTVKLKGPAYVYMMNVRYFMRPHKYATSWRLHLTWHMTKAIKM
jgi:hypothetical protein